MLSEVYSRKLRRCPPFNAFLNEIEQPMRAEYSYRGFTIQVDTAPIIVRRTFNIPVVLDTCTATVTLRTEGQIIQPAPPSPPGNADGAFYLSEQAAQAAGHRHGKILVDDLLDIHH
ncbi:hypothetical protein AAGS40_28130 (plasmid) [Paraburkholderia sp. PREW-6R]|uniref:hypothetical protein n=1 Tax=Paraburkholderia sp. PREW-6R TaxID=3141544 RepID=UPI0031F5B572